MIVVRKTNSFSKIRQEWKELYENNTELSYYQSVQIMDVLWHNLLPYRLVLRISPRFYVFTENEKIVMILPLFKKWFSNIHTGYGFKAGLGYIDAAYPKDIDDETITECLKILGEEDDIRLNIEHVQSKTALGRWLIRNGGAYAEEGYTVIDLPEDYETYYCSLSKHMKQNLRTAYNRLKTDEGEYEFACIPYAEMHGLENELQKLYLERQVNKYGKGRLYKFFVKYIDLGTKIQRVKDVDERAFILRINGRLAAYYDGIFSDRGITVPRLAIADGFNRYSPGVMLLNESIKYLIENGEKSVDLTHGTENYKLSMGGRVNQCVERMFETTMNNREVAK